MRVIMYAKNAELTNDAKTYIENKLRKLEKFVDQITEIYTEIEKTSYADVSQSFRVDISLFVPKEMLRSSGEGDRPQSALDQALPKLQAQIEKYKAKMRTKDKKKNFLSFASLFKKQIQDSPRIVKRKRFSCVKPMSEEEAIRQMNLIDHDFYLFWNANTDRFSVVYRRDDKNYGIIEPLLEEQDATIVKK